VALTPVAESAAVKVTGSFWASSMLLVEHGATLRIWNSPLSSASNMPKSCGLVEPGARVAVILMRDLAGQFFPLRRSRAPSGWRDASMESCGLGWPTTAPATLADTASTRSPAAGATRRRTTACIGKPPKVWVGGTRPPVPGNWRPSPGNAKGAA
jgi:hypothetical protein